MELASDKETPFEITGPFNQQSSRLGGTLPLPVADTSDFAVDVQTEAQSLPSQDSDETILAPLLSSDSLTLSGVVHPDMITSDRIGLSRKEVLIEWLYRFESLCRANQGKGYELVDEIRSSGVLFDPTGGTAGVLVEEASWDYTTENYLRVEWELELSNQKGKQPVDKSRQSYVDSQLNRRRSSSIAQTGIRLVQDSQANFFFDDLESVRMNRSVELNAQKILNNVDIAELGIIESGVTREIDLEGRLIRDTDTELQQKIAFLESELRGSEVQLRESITGRQFNGAISDVRTGFTEGVVGSADVSITFIEGARAVGSGNSGTVT